MTTDIPEWLQSVTIYEIDIVFERLQSSYTLIKQNADDFLTDISQLSLEVIEHSQILYEGKRTSHLERLKAVTNSLQNLATHGDKLREECYDLLERYYIHRNSAYCSTLKRRLIPKNFLPDESYIRELDEQIIRTKNQIAELSVVINKTLSILPQAQQTIELLENCNVKAEIVE